MAASMIATHFLITVYRSNEDGGPDQATPDTTFIPGQDDVDEDDEKMNSSDAIVSNDQFGKRKSMEDDDDEEKIPIMNSSNANEENSRKRKRTDDDEDATGDEEEEPKAKRFKPNNAVPKQPVVTLKTTCPPIDKQQLAADLQKWKASYSKSSRRATTIDNFVKQVIQQSLVARVHKKSDDPTAVFEEWDYDFGIPKSMYILSVNAHSNAPYYYKCEQ